MEDKYKELFNIFNYAYTSYDIDPLKRREAFNVLETFKKDINNMTLCFHILQSNTSNKTNQIETQFKIFCAQSLQYQLSRHNDQIQHDLNEYQSIINLLINSEPNKILINQYTSILAVLMYQILFPYYNLPKNETERIKFQKLELQHAETKLNNILNVYKKTHIYHKNHISLLLHILCEWPEYCYQRHFLRPDQRELSKTMMIEHILPFLLHMIDITFKLESKEEKLLAIQTIAKWFEVNWLNISNLSHDFIYKMLYILTKQLDQQEIEYIGSYIIDIIHYITKSIEYEHIDSILQQILPFKDDLTHSSHLICLYISLVYCEIAKLLFPYCFKHAKILSLLDIILHDITNHANWQISSLSFHLWLLIRQNIQFEYKEVDNVSPDHHYHIDASINKSILSIGNRSFSFTNTNTITNSSSKGKSKKEKKKTKTSLYSMLMITTIDQYHSIQKIVSQLIYILIYKASYSDHYISNWYIDDQEHFREFYRNDIRDLIKSFCLLPVFNINELIDHLSSQLISSNYNNLYLIECILHSYTTLSSFILHNSSLNNQYITILFQFFINFILNI